MIPTAMETNNNIDRLLEMLDHPEAFSEQEIMDIINCDEATRETYRQLVKVNRARNLQNSVHHPVDVDAAWQQFERKHLAQPKRDRRWLRIAAAIAGIMLMTGIAWAAVHTLSHKDKTQAETAVTAPAEDDAIVTDEPAVSDTTAEAMVVPIVFDNVPLDEMLVEIAAYYGMTVDVQNDEVRDLRFHYVWNKDDGLSKVLRDLNHFNSVNIEQKEDRLIVQ